MIELLIMKLLKTLERDKNMNGYSMKDKKSSASHASYSMEERICNDAIAN